MPPIFCHLSNLTLKFFSSLKIPLTFNVVSQSCPYHYKLAQVDKHAFNVADLEHHVYISFIPNLRSNFSPNFTLTGYRN